MEIKILNSSSFNPYHKGAVSDGKNGVTYSGIFEKQSMTIKCLPVKSSEARHRAIEEWFILKIASALEVGPKVESYFGFDILMFETCIEFTMEQCEKLIENKFNMDLLYWNMSILHFYKITHRDIKPENILLSPSYKKLVFIDFGLSTIVK